jgi:hypothetical protein
MGWLTRRPVGLGVCVGGQSALTLVTATRRYLQEGSFVVRYNESSAGKKGYLFLFSDAILLGSPAGGLSSKIKPKRFFILGNAHTPASRPTSLPAHHVADTTNAHAHAPPHTHTHTHHRTRTRTCDVRQQTNRWRWWTWHQTASTSSRSVTMPLPPSMFPHCVRVMSDKQPKPCGQLVSVLTSVCVWL